MKLETNGIFYSFGPHEVLSNIEISVPKNKITVILGPNGCGKSTLLKGLSRLIKPQKGCVYLEGRDINAISSKEVAKKLSILPQSPTGPEGLSIWDLVCFGRYPHKKPLEKFGIADELIVNTTLEKVGLYDLKGRSLDQLSGGQRQRAFIAMALAQETPLLLLDEPTAFLDMHYQFEILNLLRNLKEKDNKTILLVLHDLNMASLYGDHIILLKDGVVFKSGGPDEVLTKENLFEVFGIKALPVLSEEGLQFVFSSTT